MKKSLQEIIRKSTFEIIKGVFIYVKVKSIPKSRDHFMVSVDRDEITVITKAKNLTSLDLIERNRDDYALISLNVLVPFYSVGFLATVSSAIAQKDLNILIVSTYSKDYIMIKMNKLQTARKVLLELGFKEK